MVEKKSKKPRKISSANKKSDEKKEEKREEVIKKVEGNIEKSEEKDEKKEDAKPDKKQIFEENKILMVFLGIIFILIAAFVIYLIVSNNAKSFTYDNVTYSLDYYGKNLFYRTSIPVIYNGSKIPYNFYLYNNPKTLAKQVPFNGSLYIKPVMNLNYSEDINCNGDGGVALLNFENLYKAMGTKIVHDPNATCDPQQRYVDVNIKISNETSIQEIAPACYVINVANCDIIPATERFMTETFTTIKPYLNES